MRRPDRVDLVLLALAAGGALVDPRDPGEARLGKEFLFSLVLWTLLGLLVRAAATAARAARAEHRRASALSDVDPEAAATDAVRRERERLAADLDRCIRTALQDIQADVASVGDGADARTAAERIHGRSREATTELRRQLGLLRESVTSADRDAVTGARPGVDRATVVLAVAATAMAAVDAWAGERLYGPEFYEADAWRLPWSGLLGMAVAATVAGRRTAPVTAALLAAALLVLPREAGDVMVSAGFGLLLAAGGLTWSLAARGPRDLTADATAAVLAGAAVGSRLRDDPLNAGFLAACLGAVWAAGTLVGVVRRRGADAASRSGEHETQLQAAQAAAVQSERLVVARELHDVVSHAVGVIAMQAAAAQVSWPADPDTALAALEVIERTTAHALADLEHVVPGGAADVGRPGGAADVGLDLDLDDLVARIRAAGTAVTLVRRGDAVPDAAVYRIVQEGLTNAVRHAPGAAIEVVVDGGSDAVHVRVADDGLGPAAGTPRGFGLVGLAERVQLRGGTLRTGPGRGGRGFALEATLPVRAAAEVTR